LIYETVSIIKTAESR